MREIKFRCFNKKTNEMIEDVGLIPNKKDIQVSIGSDGIYINPKNSNERILMQFTGLLDKNGKEIYEGDIVKTKSVHVCIIKWGKCTEKSIDGDLFEYTGFVLHNVKQDKSYHFDSDPVEKIGNIYEHKHLLE